MLDSKVETLLAVYECKNYTKAAKKLNLTQPAVSQHIKQLEEELAVKLFVRDEKQIKLTSEGEIVLKYFRRMTNLYDNLQQTILDHKQNVRRLTIGITPTAANNMISTVIAKYCNENQNVHIKILTDTINNLYTLLKTYEIDVAIVEGKMTDKNFRSVLLDTDYLAIAVSRKNPLAEKTTVTIQDLKSQKFILRLPDSGTRTLFEATLKSMNESIDAFNVILEIDHVGTIKDLVEENFGVSILSKNACIEDIQKKRFKIIPVENLTMIREINVVCHQDFEHMSLIKELQKIYNQYAGIYR